jgi:hypothetical protein
LNSNRSQYGKEDRRLYQAANPGRQGQPVAARRSCTGPARFEHHGVLQGVQRPDPGHGTWSEAARGDHRLRGQVLHLRAEVAPHLDKVGKVTRAQLEEIAKTKIKDLTAADMDAAVKTIAGSARSMGIIVEGV